MSRLIQTNSKSWGESLQFAQDLPELTPQRRKRGPSRITWFLLGLAIGVAPMVIG
ncbi:hypothetical protein [Blastomonas fulva]|uniref:hypothetical protein n=1 Tax=Blastomonas fulva TaxID=1550728 RepID=UPI0025A390C3|nr:hypothetical protein [Blastomonas fulva]MDM7928685.1 hypothetical protein [Blastomonas fulva]MDM7964471.1 hypothetical protein [Blastomonas fulva]